MEIDYKHFNLFFVTQFYMLIFGNFDDRANHSSNIWQILGTLKFKFIIKRKIYLRITLLLDPICTH
jgi:predicted phosphatase